jgi:multidrug efflux pump subunit AcrA (membrane-fusion protein)
VRRPPSRSTLGLAAAAVALVGLTAASCRDNSGDIGVGAAGRGDVVEVVDAPGTVTAKAVATLSSPADGTVVALTVQPGDKVAVGQVLAIVDSPSAQARLEQASAALDSLRGGGSIGRTNLAGTQAKTDQAAGQAFATARDAANRITDPTLRAALLAQVDAAEKAYQEAAASARALVTSVQRGLASVGQAMSALTAAQRTQAQAAYDLAKSTVDALTLRAPVAGVVQLGGASAGSGPNLNDLLGAAAGGTGSLPSATGGTAPPTGDQGPGVDPAIGVGGRVSAGTPLLTVVDTSELGLLTEVDETDVLLVQPGITATVELDAAPGAKYDATVSSTDVLPSTSARGGVSYRARLKLAGGKYDDGRDAPTPRPGMNAVAHLQVRSVRDAVTVPAAAVFNSGGKDAVWLVRDGKAVQATIRLGVTGQEQVQVLAGLGTGDRLVVRGTDKVTAGMKLP